MLKKSRIKKIEKLARNLQTELNKGLIFDDHKLQEQIPYEKMETKKLTLSTAFVDTITHIVSIIDSETK